ncbi:MAG: ABC transporter permease [Calditrichaeota bacterium]|nr:ABC transporter permease [Calditrichota bacterium]
MRPVLAMIKKEFLQVKRTREMLALLFMFPLIQMLVLGYAITTEVKHVRLIIVDLDNSRISRELVRAFQHTDRFDVQARDILLTHIGEYLQGWKAQMALVIPRDFGRLLRRGLQPDVQLIVDGVDGNTAGVALGYARGILQQTATQLSPAGHPVSYRPTAPRLHLQERMWYNLNLDSAQFMIPGIVVVLLTIIPMMLTAMSLVREREIGTLEQLLVTPMGKLQLLAGKLIPFLILSFAELVLVMKVAQWIFRVQMHGSYPLLGAIAFIYLFTTLGLGIFISTFTQTQQQAMFVAWFFMVFMILMSGFFIPIPNMPELLQTLTYLNPMRYMMFVIRDIFQKGSSWVYLLPDIGALTGFGLLIFLASILKFSKRIG